jgi:hypothetical protein
MTHLKHHAKHLLMCSPMLIVAVYILATGGSAIGLLFVIPCMLMMGMMMGDTGRSGKDGGGGEGS